MTEGRERVRALVREELERILAAEVPRDHPALLEIHQEPECAEDLSPRPCVIEPHRPCYHSGYCKRLGY